MDWCEQISNAKECVENFADAYVKASNIGANTPDMLSELLLLNGYIDALCRYEHNPKRHKTKLLTEGNILLTTNNKILSLKSCHLECVNPDEVNCLTEDEVCLILQQIQLKCPSCECNC